MRQAIINKDLMGKEQLYYTKNTYGWYYCKYFTLREDYCYIKDDRLVKEEFCYIDEIDILPCNYYNVDKISFWNINNEKYSVLEIFDITYKLLYKFYKYIISNIYCDIYVKYNISFAGENASKLIFYDDKDIVGWLEPCTIEIIKNEYIEEDTKVIPKEIENNIIFQDVTPFDKGISRVIFNDFCAKLDSKGNIIQKFNCEDCWFYDEYTAIKINRKWGAIDLSNNMIIPPKYDNLNYLKNNFWEITINDKKGIIDTLGNIILPTIYDNFSYVDDNYIIAEKNDLCGVINYSGKIILPFKYNKLSFSRKKGKKHYLYATQNHSMGIIDMNGNIIIPYLYKNLIYLNKRTIAAKLDNNKFILINEKNKQICSQVFEDIHSNYDEIDIYPAKLNGFWGFIDDLGNTRIDFNYTDATEFWKGYCEVSIYENPDFFDDYGLINKDGTLVLDYKYSIYCSFVIDDDRFIVEQDNKSFIIDKKSNVIVDKLYTRITPIKSDGFLCVTLNNGYKGFIDRNGKPLKINKKTLDIPITSINYNYDNLSQIEKISILFDGKEL